MEAWAAPAAPSASTTPLPCMYPHVEGVAMGPKSKTRDEDVAAGVPNRLSTSWGGGVNTGYAAGRPEKVSPKGMPAVMGVKGGPFTGAPYVGVTYPGRGAHGEVHMITTRTRGDLA